MAMGFIESAVVVYLRAIYYPEGFAFPLRSLDPGIVSTEVLRGLPRLRDSAGRSADLRFSFMPLRSGISFTTSFFSFYSAGLLPC